MDCTRTGWRWERSPSVAPPRRAPRPVRSSVFSFCYSCSSIAPFVCRSHPKIACATVSNVVAVAGRGERFWDLGQMNAIQHSRAARAREAGGQHLPADRSAAVRPRRLRRRRARWVFSRSAKPATVAVMYVGIVLNPLASKNRARADDRCIRFRRILGPRGEVHESRSLEDLGEIVAGLLPRASHLVSDGGDGTLHWLINAVRSQVADPERWPAFVPSRAGTIDFVAHKARVRGRAESIVRSLAAAAKSGQPPPEVRLDTLNVDGRSVDGGLFQRVGFALAAGGVGCRFFDQYYEARNPGRAAIVKIIAGAIRDMAASAVRPGRTSRPDLFRPTRAEVVIDGEEVPTRMHSALHAGGIRREPGRRVTGLPAGARTGRAAISGR
jgi:hypothetical protein